MVTKLKSGKIILRVGSVSMDKQDIGILLALALTVTLLSVVVGRYGVVVGYIIVGIIFRNLLSAKGHIKK